MCDFLVRIKFKKNIKYLKYLLPVTRTSSRQQYIKNLTQNKRICGKKRKFKNIAIQKN